MISGRKSHLFAALYGSTRPISSGVAGLLSFAAVWLRGGPLKQAFLAGLTMCLVTMFGFVLNDVLDYEKDVAAGVLRPISAGELLRRAALAFGSFLLVSACVIAWVIGPGAPLLLLTAVALIAYTPLARRIPLLKGVYVAALCLTPLAYGAVISRARVPGVAYAVDAAFVWGREILMDADEIAGDQLAGMRTVAVILGASFTRRLAILVMVMSLICLNLVARGPLGTVAAAFSVGSLVCILAWPAVRESTRVGLTRISMLAAALALASS